MAMSEWMESVTGRSNSEHQAWRDNFNGGWAAGDWTGNVNRSIAAERYDAGEWNPQIAQYGGYTQRNPSVPDGYTRTVSADGNTVYLTRTSGGGSFATTGVGTPAGSGGPTAVAPNQPGGTVPGNGKSNQSGPGWYQQGGGYQTTQRTAKEKAEGVPDPANPGKFKQLPTEYSTSVHELNVGGLSWESNPWWSNTEDFEIRYGEPGEWVGGVVVAAADLVWNVDRVRQAGPVWVGEADKAISRWVHDNWAATSTDIPDPMSIRPMSEW